MKNEYARLANEEAVRVADFTAQWQQYTDKIKADKDAARVAELSA